MIEYDPFWRARPLEYAGEAIFTIALLLFAGAAQAVRKVSRFTREARAQNWSTANGRVTTGTVNAFRGRYFAYAMGQIGYAYEVQGNYYAGYMVHQFYDEQNAWTFVDALQDKSVIVRYKVDHPERSTLLEADQPGNWPS